ncbi:hypothetical protein IQ07DRAFT_513622 [Pyrenochaeta sp. DS3sAY3a]|nr:hypothetical protein IQ07DRAFT_513622 [Pyrenochaeta sp. DS3sAY3a]
MRKTLRRSCDACAKSKLSCDLRTPKCSRCTKKNTACVYANEPLTSSPTDGFTAFLSPSAEKNSPNNLTLVKTNPLRNGFISQTFDPFESYPQTRLPRAHVQRLIQHFLSSIAFQYYPLDLNTTSNPFVVSWWPLALADPALFHVSLQTASWDVDRHAQNGFRNSEILMADSVSLLRLRIEDPQLASQDETMNSVVTLAAIEYGKGNTAVGKMHIEGVKRMVRLRGGIGHVKLTSPLTARMVSWVSMIVMQSPQFPIQDHFGDGEGISPIPQWHQAKPRDRDPITSPLDNFSLDPAISDTFFRLHSLLHDPQLFAMSSTDLHDLACFVLHKLLSEPIQPENLDEYPPSATSECLRYAMVLYVLIIHGPAYYSHSELQYNTTMRLKLHLGEYFALLQPEHGQLTLWLLSIGAVASENTNNSEWYMTQARRTAIALHASTWEDIKNHLQKVLWFDIPHAEYDFQRRWTEIFKITPG